MIQKIKKFLKEENLEWKKVSKPTYQDISGSTVVVVITVAISTVYLWVIDLVLLRLRNLFFG
jgi:preprotein translocase subunit SecE